MTSGIRFSSEILLSAEILRPLLTAMPKLNISHKFILLGFKPVGTPSLGHKNTSVEKVALHLIKFTSNK